MEAIQEKISSHNRKRIIKSFLPPLILATFFLLPSFQYFIRLYFQGFLYIGYFCIILFLLAFINNKVVNTFIAVILFVVGTLEISFKLVFQKWIQLDEIVNALDSNPQETWEFLYTYNSLIIVFLLAVSLFALLLFLTKVSFTINYKRKKLFRLYKYGMLSISVIVFSYFYHFEYKSFINFYPFSIYKNYTLYSKEIGRFRSGYAEMNNSESNITHNSSRKFDIIWVLGESARKDHYSIYKDSTINATPELKERSKSKGFFSLNRMRSVALNTRYSLASMLSLSPIKNFKDAHETPNVFHVMNQNGFDTYFFENNNPPDEKNDIHSTLISLMLSPAKYKNTNPRHSLDNKLLKLMASELKYDSNNFSFVHLAGSHVAYSERYPEGYLSDSSHSDYVKSIRYTDTILNEMIQRTSKKRPTLIIYLSDHGEYFSDSDGIDGHGAVVLAQNKNVNTYRKTLDAITKVPAFFYVNPSLQDKYPEVSECLSLIQNLKLSQDNVSHTIIGLSMMKTQHYDETLDACNTNFIEKKRLVFNSDNNYLIENRLINVD